MEEYEVRQNTKDYIMKNINQYIEGYISEYRENIGFLVYYPLISIEMCFQKASPNHQNAIIDRYAISWFIGKIFEKGIKLDLELEYRENEFIYFENNISKKILALYKDFLLCDEIMDMNSIAKSQFEQCGPNKYTFTAAYIEGGFRKEYIYYYGLDSSNFNLERDIKMKPANRLVEKYVCFKPKSVHKLKRLLIDIDREILDLCYKCVGVDLVHLGGNVKSTIIKNINELKLIIGFYYYCSLVTEYAFSMGKILNKVTSFDTLFYYDEKWFINKVSTNTGLSVGKVEKYLNYFVFKGKGSLQEFPIIIHKDKILFIPSSWMLNDLQYSLVNGHYYKNETFRNRDKTISHSVVKTIISKIEKFENIIFGQECYYEFYNNTTKINSDVDVTLYDKNSNTFILIECKWKDNHYVFAGKENYKKIHQSLNEIYSDQINKHKAFINNDKEKLSLVLEGKVEPAEIGDNPDILYIAVDKRSQLFIGNRMLVPLNGLLVLFEIYSNDTVLNLDKVVESLRQQKTDAFFINLGNFKELKISDKITLVTEDLYSF
ncbi:hypothetical protein [Bacillus velezensis]|uniref:hypothetical protein n=1 Tax=Bacillus velezensis TaxID=492670 RepID=UPI002FBDA549